MGTEKNGFVVAIDGPDGCGKTSQVKLLEAHFRNDGQSVHTTRMSGGTPIGEALRVVSLSDVPRSGETDLHISLAMAAALGEDIRPRKGAGETIIIDRSPLAMVAYNGYGSQMIKAQDALDACAETFENLQIDLLIYLTAAQSILDERRQQRGKADFFEKQSAEYHQRVRQGYEAGLDHLKQIDSPTRIIAINASPDVQTVHQGIIDSIK